MINLLIDFFFKLNCNSLLILEVIPMVSKLTGISIILPTFSPVTSDPFFPLLYFKLPRIKIYDDGSVKAATALLLNVLLLLTPYSVPYQEKNK